MERLVSISVQRDTPLDVLRACREVLPTCELVHVGGNRWWLGYIKNSPAADVGYIPPGGATIQHQLQMQGFRWLGEYTEPFITASYLRKELEFMFGRTDAELAQDYARTEAVSDGSARDADHERIVREKSLQEGRSIFAHVFRKRRSVLNAGIPIPATP
jgi:hypothetical protein